MWVEVPTGKSTRAPKDALERQHEKIIIPLDHRLMELEKNCTVSQDPPIVEALFDDDDDYIYVGP